MHDMISEALAAGFAHAALIGTADLVYVPEYRKYCEENLCGNFGRLPVCPPACGTSDQMHERMLRYAKCLVLQSEFVPQEKTNQEYIRGKRIHNELTEKLLEQLQLDDVLVMSCGPWKNYSCMSAYSIDAEAMSKSCGMVCWGNDGIVRYFSSILFN
ncbi:MAG: DUF2284 domain-containing protein [Selenomonadaceae bacterium]|nr:DUF2284 domain-containing protein [Selenomonadaceae bacterium]